MASQGDLRRRHTVTENSGSNGDLESQSNVGAWVTDEYGRRIHVPTDQYGRPIPSPHYGYDGLHYSGWVCSWYNLCWGLAWLVGVVIMVLGLIGFIVALNNQSRISTLEGTVASLTSTTQSQQMQIDSLIVPFDHTAPGPLQTRVKKQFINVGAVAAMTLPGDLSSYLNDEICVISKTAFAHTITMGAGATWDGANQIATLGGAVNDGLCFIVTSATSVFVTVNNNVAFS